MKFLFFTSLILLINSPKLFAQFGYPKIVKLNGEEDVTVSQVVDIDNDGFKDIATYSFSQEIILYLNKGNLFKANDRQRIVPYSSFLSSPQFDFSDLDSDDLPELISTYRTPSNQSGFLLFNNLGNGNFDMPDTLSIQVSETGPYIVGIKLFDINNDGFPDIIYASNHSIKIFAGTSDSHTFLNGNTVYTTNLYIDKFDIKDINNDGNFDIVYNSNENNMSYSYLNVLKNTGSNYVYTNLMSSEFDQKFDNVRYEDINNDGLVDIVFQDNTRSLIAGTNTGNFNFTYNAVPFQSNTSISFELSDMNGDNYPEVVLANDKTYTYFPNNQGVFLNSIPSTIGFIFDYIKLHCADFNNDGKDDFLFRNTNLRLTLNAGNSFGYTTMITKRIADTDLSSLDFDHNGTEDLIFTNSWISNEGDGKFGAVNFFNPSSNAMIYGSSIGDIDQDGDYDIVGFTNDSLFEFINQGNNYDFTPNLITTHTFFRAVELSDLNNDGRLDISYLIHDNGNKLVFRLNQMNGWGNEQLILFTIDPLPYDFRFRFSDFNGDSKPDLIIPTYNYLRILVNNGTGFNEITSYVSGDSYLQPNYGYSILDFNLDGKKDIAIHTYDVDYAYYLSILINDGTMNFTVQRVSGPYMYGALANLFTDLDSDYDLDMMLAPDYGHLNYHENHYNLIDQNITEEIYLIGQGVQFIAAAQLFGNESKELIITKAGMVVVYENLAIPMSQPSLTGNAYPNPANTAITFGVPFNQLQTYSIEIYSSLGILEYSGTIDYENTYLDITSLVSGLHLAKITNNQTGEIIFTSFMKI